MYVWNSSCYDGNKSNCPILYIICTSGIQAVMMAINQIALVNYMDLRWLLDNYTNNILIRITGVGRAAKLNVSRI